MLILKMLHREPAVADLLLQQRIVHRLCESRSELRPDPPLRAGAVDRSAFPRQLEGCCLGRHTPRPACTATYDVPFQGLEPCKYAAPEGKRLPA